jgi:hypothetical protein
MSVIDLAEVKIVIIYLKFDITILEYETWYKLHF